MLFFIALLLSTMLMFGVALVSSRLYIYWLRRTGVLRTIPTEDPRLPTRYVCYCDDCIISHHKRELRRQKLCGIEKRIYNL